MPNELVRSVSAFFNRNQKERKSLSDKRGVRSQIQKSINVPQSTPKHTPIEFNDDYVEPLDMLSKDSNSGRYDEPWEGASHNNRSRNYDAPWGSSDRPPGLNYDEPWDAIGSTNGTISSETGKTSSSSGSSSNRMRPNVGHTDNFKPDPRLIIDPTYKSEESITSSLIRSPDMPHRRARSLIPKPITQHTRLEAPENLIRPAKSFESIPSQHKVPQTPGISESPLNWQKRQNETENMHQSSYMQQLVRQTPAEENTNSLDDLLYGPRKKNVYDSPWKETNKFNFPDNGYQTSNQSKSTLQSSIRQDTSICRASELNNSMSSHSTQSSSEQGSFHQSILLLDQMDYYRASMTRQEAEKILYGEPVGSFVVRRNTSNPAWYSLSVVTAEQGVLHLVISDECSNSSASSGWHIGGFTSYTAEFNSIPELINHYYVNFLNIKGTKGLHLIKHSNKTHRKE